MITPLTFVPGGTEIVVELRLPVRGAVKRDGFRWKCPPNGMSAESARREAGLGIRHFFDCFLPLEQEPPR